MLLEIAVGDAYGAGFEYVDREIIERENTLTRYVKHPRHAIVPGCYTDDAQMSIAVAEAIVSEEEWTPLLLATKFVDAFKRDPREGYAMGFYSFLQSVRDGHEFLERIQPDSDKSGAAMRAGPVGVFPTIKEVIEKATVQAKVTHDTPDGIRAAVAAALMTHYFLYRLGPKRELGAFLETNVVGVWSEPWRGKVKAKGWMSVHAAVTAVMASETMSALLKSCIAFTGDVDTVAAIALAAGSCSIEMAQDLPDGLVMGLENRQYGRDYLRGLDAQLLQRVG